MQRHVNQMEVRPVCASVKNVNEPQHDKTKEMTYAPSEDSDQSGHPLSLIKVFAMRSVGRLGHKGSSCRQGRL